MAESRIDEFYKEVSEDLTRTMNFWIKHSHDDKYGYVLLRVLINSNGTHYMMINCSTIMRLIIGCLAMTIALQIPIYYRREHFIYHVWVSRSEYPVTYVWPCRPGCECIVANYCLSCNIYPMTCILSVNGQTIPHTRWNRTYMLLWFEFIAEASSTVWDQVARSMTTPSTSGCRDVRYVAENVKKQMANHNDHPRSGEFNCLSCTVYVKDVNITND